MKTMNMYEIVSYNERETTSILWDCIHPYKKMLYVYYKRLYCCEPIVMVISVSNACQYAKIVPSNEFNEIVHEFCDGDENEMELINYQSIMLKDILK